MVGPMSVYDRTPAWIYLVALVLGLPATWLLVGTTGENVPGMLALIVALICWVVTGAVLSKRKRGRWLIVFLLAAIITGFLFWWASISRPVAYPALSQSRHCKMQFHQWYTGRCVVSFYENGVRVGTATLSTGLFTHPWAMFPGPAGTSVVCFSWLDTTYAAFTVDFARRNERGVSIPRKLRDAVDYSDFDVRACTTDEVAFVANFIRTASPDALFGLSRWGRTTVEPKENDLLFLKLATNPYDSRDPVLKDARPQILPGDG